MSSLSMIMFKQSMGPFLSAQCRRWPAICWMSTISVLYPYLSIYKQTLALKIQTIRSPSIPLPTNTPLHAQVGRYPKRMQKEKHPPLTPNLEFGLLALRLWSFLYAHNALSSCQYSPPNSRQEMGNGNLTSCTHVANNVPSLLKILCVTTPRPSPDHGLSISLSIHSSATTRFGS